MDSNQWSACSIGATAHWADRLFRMRKPPMRLPPLAVIGGFPANFIVVTAHWADRSLKFEKEFDEIPATGGHRILSPIDVSHLDATGSGFITGNTKTRITARVILAFVWSVLDSNQ